MLLRNLSIPQAVNRIFGHRPLQEGGGPNPLRSPWKLLRSNRIGPAMQSWFMPEAKLMGRMSFYESDRIKSNRERIERRRSRGKEPTKKGEGKIAQRRAKEQQRAAAKAAKAKGA